MEWIVHDFENSIQVDGIHAASARQTSQLALDRGKIGTADYMALTPWISMDFSESQILVAKLGVIVRCQDTLVSPTRHQGMDQ